MQKIAATVLLASGFLVGVGCSRSDRNTQGEANREATSADRNARGEADRNAVSTNKGTAYVRFVSAIDAHDNTDLYFGDRKLFATLNANKPTEYMEVPAERRDFVLREAGRPDGVEIEKNSEGLSAAKHYTVFAYEDNGKPVLRVVNDDEGAPSAGKAKVRIIHAAPGMDPVSVYVPGSKDKFASESRFSTTSTWQEVNPVRGPLEVRVGDRAPAASVPGRIEAGKLYTIVVKGGPKTGKKLNVVEMVDSPVGS